MTQPHYRIAQQYMQHKGLGHIRPERVMSVHGQHCWYFYYRLPEGLLELEVAYDEELGWTTQTDLAPHLRAGA